MSSHGFGLAAGPWPVAALLALAVALLALAACWGLRRELGRLARAVDEARSGDVLTRFHSRAPGLKALAAAFNQILRRLHDLEAERRRDEQRRRQLLAALSHDLRTPLTAVLGYLEAVAGGHLDPVTEQQYLATACRKGRELWETLDRIFEWARLDLEVADLPSPRINLAERLRQVLIEFYPAFHQQGVALRPELPEEAWVRCHPDLVDRVTRNLVDNALRHARGITCLAVTLRPAGRTWELVVADDGEPVAADVLANLFVPFHRRPGSPGAGLGLAISRQLARAWGGDLRACPRRPRGLAFIVSWPRSEPVAASRAAQAAATPVGGRPGEGETRR
ncbi:HAMP domain-containing histidine kinase [Thermaerobacter sp. PB12/4term]|uniref:sensor histidine kinase n=1 Tax=Thermaerobacter sp. PB12/4term TaxID=2293838 RepID=UPI000E327ADF|nr:HAMP domain-containing sensor histidine kinase [Thermaerobacter sp. PB12/4term]QIA27475.1 HAMP domain-containing histidine kinase [Thermaerobacter sp. PB12/4term]